MSHSPPSILSLPAFRSRTLERTKMEPNLSSNLKCFWYRRHYGATFEISEAGFKSSFFAWSMSDASDRNFDIIRTSFLNEGGKLGEALFVFDVAIRGHGRGSYCNCGN